MKWDRHELRQWLIDRAHAEWFDPSLHWDGLWEIAKIGFMRKCLSFAELTRILNWGERTRLGEIVSFPLYNKALDEKTQLRRQRRSHPNGEDKDAVHVHMRGRKVPNGIRRARSRERDAEAAAVSQMREVMQEGFHESEYPDETGHMET